MQGQNAQRAETSQAGQRLDVSTSDIVFADEKRTAVVCKRLAKRNARCLSVSVLTMGDVPFKEQVNENRTRIGGLEFTNKN